ncbi:MAG: hypothetical protein BWY70_00633 [Bacteroidetes bacterium ADurb.Bin408]|nr:MAG: hypothetical protein BWY70_00633 [Bacteroidetes bacterium ADurb.Bin408]
MKTSNCIFRLIIAGSLIRLLSVNYVAAQNMIGFTGNYAGLSGIYLNPSSIANTKMKLDINLFTFGGHMHNNYYYIPKKQYNPINPFRNGFADKGAYKLYPLNGKSPYLFTREQMHLPAVMYANGKNAFAFGISWRLEADAVNIPQDIVHLMNEGIFAGREVSHPINTPQHADRFHFALASWEELSATYSRRLVQENGKYFAAGITGKLLLGNAACYFSNKNLDYYYANNKSISFSNAQANFGVVVPRGLINGYGLGADLGVTYAVSDRSTTRSVAGFYNYRYRLGAVLLDLGAIRFGSGITYHVNSYDESVNANGNTVSNIYDMGTTTGGMVQRNSLSFVLPTALSLQFDYNINDAFFLGSQFVQGFRFTGCQVRRPGVLAFIPRYERRRLEVSAPVSLYDWRMLRMGLHLRIFGISFGVEKSGWLLPLSDFKAVDGYIAFKYSIGKKELTKPMFDTR